MKIQLNKEDILELVKEHLTSQGFQIGEVSVVTKESEEYEYYGIGIHEERSKVKSRNFEGIEAIIKNRHS